MFARNLLFEANLVSWGHFFGTISILWEKSPHTTWRGGRVVEGAALEMLFTLPGNEGSNPSLSVESWLI
jgi:hypothetical protein